MTKKVDLLDLKRLEEKLSNYTPISKFITLDNSMLNYAQRDKVDEIELKVQELSEQVGLRSKIEEVDNNFTNLKNEIDGVISTLATKEDLEYDMKRQNAKLEKNLKRIREEIKVLNLLEARITNFAQKLNNYPTIAVMNNKLKDVWNNFDK